MKHAKAGPRKSKPSPRPRVAKPPAEPHRDASFVAFVVEQLGALGGVRSKSMFGGHGLYARDTFFAVIDEGRLYFRVDDSTRPRYAARGMRPFAPAPNMVMKSYYEVPLDVLEDARELVGWAREACVASRDREAARRMMKAPAAFSRAPQGRRSS